MKADRWQRLQPVAIVTLAFLHNLYVSWLKWGDVLVDCGRELDIARQMAEGKTLYDDLRYWYGPLAPWIDSTLFSLFGVHTGVLMAAGIVCAALTCVVLYRLTRCFASRLCSASVTVLFLYACAFGHLVANGIFNFVMPYAQSATYGILVCLASIYFLVRYLKKLQTRDLILSLLLLVVSALTKLELFTAVLATHAAAQVGLLWSHRMNWRRAFIGYAVAAAAIVGIYGILYSRIGPDLFADNILVMLHPSLRQYTMSKSGLDDLPKSLSEMALSTLVLLCVAGAIGFIASLAQRPNLQSMKLLLGTACAAIGAIAYYLLSVDLSFRVIPLIALLVFVVLFVDGWRNPARRETILPHFVLWIFAFLCLSRLVMRPVAYHYGFFMLVPSLVALGVFWFDYAPRCVAYLLRNRELKPAGWAFTAGGAGVFAGLAAAHFSISSIWYANRTVEIKTSHAHMYINAGIGGVPVGRIYAETIRLLGSQPRNTKVFALPQGVGLMYCAGLPNPYGSGGFFPPEVSVNYDDEHLLARLQAAPPDLVLRTANTSEFSGNFGMEYGRKTWEWILANYEPCISLGKGNFVLILSRKGAPYPFPDVPPEFRAK